MGRPFRALRFGLGTVPRALPWPAIDRTFGAQKGGAPEGSAQRVGLMSLEFITRGRVRAGLMAIVLMTRRGRAGGPREEETWRSGVPARSKTCAEHGTRAPSRIRNKEQGTRNDEQRTPHQPNPSKAPLVGIPTTIRRRNEAGRRHRATAGDRISGSETKSAAAIYGAGGWAAALAKTTQETMWY